MLFCISVCQSAVPVPHWVTFVATAAIPGLLYGYDVVGVSALRRLIGSALPVLLWSEAEVLSAPRSYSAWQTQQSSLVSAPPTTAPPVPTWCDLRLKCD